MTKIPINPDRKSEIKEIVYQAIVRGACINIPVEIKKICKSYPNIRVIPFSVQMRRRNMTLEEVYAQCETEDACADYYAHANKYIIYYNDVIKWKYINSNRYRWSIAHELGHILLGHHIKYEKTRIFRSELSNSEYNYLETEADYFAQLILVPHAAIASFSIKDARTIKILCQISNSAATRRHREYIEWHKHMSNDDKYDNRIFRYYFNFIFKRKCKKCNTGLIQRYGKYCPVCGQKNTLQWGDGDKMKYPLLETHENGKLKECPICHNEETNIDGNYCQICGSYIINKCENFDCGNTNTLPSNARFCPLCGGRSSFHNANFLKAWDYNESTTVKDGFLSIPDVFDMELPFN